LEEALGLAGHLAQEDGQLVRVARYLGREGRREGGREGGRVRD